MKNYHHKSIVMIIALFLFLHLSWFFYIPTLPAGEQPPNLPVHPRPTEKTDVKLESFTVNLELNEDATRVSSTYIMVNPNGKRSSVVLQLPAYAIIDNITANNEIIPVNYDEKNYSFNWEIILEPNEECNLHVKYKTMNSSAGDLLVSGFSNLADDLGTDELYHSSLWLHFGEVNPGQFRDIQPRDYTFQGNALVWKWAGRPACNDILITADVEGEKRTWEKTFTEKEENLFKNIITGRHYLSAAFFYAQKYRDAAFDDKLALGTGHAYYLEKAGEHEKALKLWKELYDDGVDSPYVYWALGKAYEGQINKLAELYNRVRERRVHPLLQSWLAQQLPPNKLKLSPPELFEISAVVVEGNSGLLIQGAFYDQEDDIAEVSLVYHWENSSWTTENLDFGSFIYVHKIAHFIPTGNSTQRLYYELRIKDKSGHETSSGLLEAFFLNNQISSYTYSLQGAKLVVCDYTYTEQEKIHQWFKNYLHMAVNAKFIPMKGKSPYLILLGKQHQFIENYQGSYFLLYAPAPFSPDKVKLHIHRYFLTHWYGEGWAKLTDSELTELGDGLLLGAGPAAKTLKYLQSKNTLQFYKALEAVGQGSTWQQALRDNFQMTAKQVKAGVLWYTYRNRILAIVIIFSFAWLGKSQILVKLIKALR